MAWLSMPTAAEAGAFLGLNLKTGLFSFRPVADEPTSNFYGLGPELTLGYSIGQVWDILAYGSYSMGNVGSLGSQKDGASLLGYGLLLGARMGEVAYLAMKGGLSEYQLDTKSPKDLYVVTGGWAGNELGFQLATVSKVDKRDFFQIFVEYMHIIAKDSSGQVTIERKVDHINLGMTFTFNNLVHDLNK